MASIKQKYIGEIVLTTGSTVNIDSGDISAAPFTVIDNASIYRVTGTQTLSVGNFVITITGSSGPTKNTQIDILWEAVATPGSNNVIIAGATIPQSLVGKNFIVRCTYNGSAWVVVILADWEATLIIDAARLSANAVTTDKLIDDAVTLAKMASLAKGLIIIGDASGNPATLSLATDGKLLIGDATNGAATYVLSGDVTMNKGGVVAIGAVKVLDAMINDVDASKLTGSIAEARLAANSVANTKLTQITKIDSKYSATATTEITTEEVLWSKALGAALLSSDGMGVKIEAFGTCAATANTKTIKLKVDGNVVVSNGTTTAPNGKNWQIESIILRSGATSSTSKGSISFDGVADEIDSSKASITWANDISVSITGQNGTAAANDIILELVVLTIIK